MFPSASFFIDLNKVPLDTFRIEICLENRVVFLNTSNNHFPQNASSKEYFLLFGYLFNCICSFVDTMVDLRTKDHTKLDFCDCVTTKQPVLRYSISLEILHKIIQV